MPRDSSERSRRSRSRGKHLALGAGLGAALGVALGSIAAGAGLGVVAGLLLGSFAARRRDSGPDRGSDGGSGS